MLESRIPHSHEEAMHVVYCVDAGDHMVDSGLRGELEQAIKRALLELKSTDTFNIIVFAKQAVAFSTRLLPPLFGNIDNAVQFLMDASLSGDSDALCGIDSALRIPGVSHVYLVSPGPLAADMSDVDKIRAHIKGTNERGIKLSCIGIGSHPSSEFSALMRGIASDNEGTYFQMDAQEES
jgi:hypothetical protein